MEAHRTKDGKFVAATYVASRGRFRTMLTQDYTSAESPDIDNIPGVRKYATKKSLNRALRNYYKKS